MNSVVKNVLEIDSQCRTKGISNDLIHLESLEPKDWDFSLPTLLTDDSNFYRKRMIVKNSEQFSANFFKNHPIFKNFDFNNTLIAGGCIGHYLINKDKFSGDIDIFIYGLDEEKATRKVRNLLINLMDSYTNIEIEKAKEQKIKNDKDLKKRGNKN